ncbi:MAG: radical SAM family heme chaperone HemW [Bacteroidetes bacterium]|nr:radical SAM family heme chaperone HemW [Bacteroidota bacterium]
MAGLYVHIPFCRRKCHYCNFFSVVTTKYRDAFFDSLLEEIFIRKNYLEGIPVRTIYLGGGTPSFVSPAIIDRILSSIRNYYQLTSDIEITLEANPDDVTISLMQQYRALGINRLSIGVQSFFDDDLQYLNRLHSAERGYQSIAEAKEAGFENISLDLIYGIPTLTNEKWEQNLEKAFSLGIPHISAYSLTVEPKTALDFLIRKKAIPGPQEEQSIEHFQIMQEKMKMHDFLHYEISNFCLEGFYSKHNSMYWTGEHYLGLGPSAHSYDGVSRQWNVGSLVQYIDQIARNDRFYQREELTTIQKFNEYVMVSLRTIWGCDLEKIRREFGVEFSAGSRQSAVPFIESGDMIEKDDVLYLTDKGKLFADGIAASLFVLMSNA